MPLAIWVSLKNNNRSTILLTSASISSTILQLLPQAPLRCSPVQAKEGEFDLCVIVFCFGVSANTIYKWAQKLWQLCFLIRTKHERHVGKAVVCRSKAEARQFGLDVASKLQMSQVSLLWEFIAAWNEHLRNGLEVSWSISLHWWTGCLVLGSDSVGLSPSSFVCWPRVLLSWVTTHAFIT